MRSPRASPFLQLPTELLIEICWQSVNLTSLLRVCRGLRRVICSTPLFWGSIRIVGRDCTTDATIMVNNYLERGASCPIEVTIYALEPITDAKTAMWGDLAAHKARIASLCIHTDTLSLLGKVLKTILAGGGPSALPLLRKMDIRHEEDPDSRLPHVDPLYPLHLLRCVPASLPTLTTLVLPFLDVCIPYPTAPLQSLEKLVFDGSTTCLGDFPGLYQIAHFLSRTPHLKTFWCKDHASYTYQRLPDSALLPSIYETPNSPVDIPVRLRCLTSLALTVPGYGLDIMHILDTPNLEELHLDGTRDDIFGAEVEWLSWFPGRVRGGLQTMASRSPRLLRLAVVGAYLDSETWDWILGCGPVWKFLPFPLLESLSLRELSGNKDEVTNTFDDSLLERCAADGRVPLRRLVYLTCEPLLSAHALCHFVDSAIRRLTPGETFELEVDSATGLDLLESEIRATLYADPPHVREWWIPFQRIDACEGTSY